MDLTNWRCPAACAPKAPGEHGDLCWFAHPELLERLGEGREMLAAAVLSGRLGATLTPSDSALNHARAVAHDALRTLETEAAKLAVAEAIEVCARVAERKYAGRGEDALELAGRAIAADLRALK